MKVRQYTLKYKKSEGRTIVTTGWIDADLKIKPGFLIKIKGDDRWWTVTFIHDVILDQSETSKQWNVGGIKSKR